MRLLITGGSGFIGTNFIDLLLLNKHCNFINIDKQKPLKAQHISFWVNCNILDRDKLNEVINKYKPTHVLHLAAKTDTASNNLEDYKDNTEGTANLIQIISQCETMLHVVITSTQYVYKSKEYPLPPTDISFAPHTAYGISKKITEELIRNSSMNCAWTIIRPTNVWGPWNMRYPNELFKIIDQGLYVHPRNIDTIKSFAYVKNVTFQIFKILVSPTDIVNKNVFYVGDYPMNSIKWINSFSLGFTGKAVRTVPKQWLQILALLGDYIQKLKIPYPLNSVRFNNMIDDYDTPMKKTIDVFGISHPNLDENVKETIHWIKNEGKPYFKYWRKK